MASVDLDGARRTDAWCSSGNIRRGDDLAQPLVGGVLVPPDDVAADHATLLLVAGMVGAVEVK
jgi:hypothetical protein